MDIRISMPEFFRRFSGRSSTDARVQALLFAIYSGLILGLTACNPTVPRPGSDTTPPKVRWSVFDQETRNITRVDGSGTITVKLADTLDITFFADDPEGVRHMQLKGTGTIRCQAGDGQSIGQWGDTPQDMTLPQGNSVATSAFLLATVPNSPVCVGYDMSFISFFIQFDGSGENYGGLSTSGRLTIEFQP